MDFYDPGHLTAADVAAIDDLLARAGGDIESVEFLDGFFAALIVAPDLMLPSGWLPHVLGDPDDPSRPGFESMEQAQSTLALLMRHWNAIVAALAGGGHWDPIVATDEADHPGRDWAMGFLKGVGLTREDWRPVLGEDERAGLLVPVLMLANEDHPDPRLRPPPITPAQRNELLMCITAGLPQLYADSRSPPRPERKRRPSKRARARARPKRKRRR